jgi:ubiquinone/menaquinone biosynthesis C-methylase UbiE
MKVPSSNKEWLFWGRTDPLFGVATRSGREADGRNPWTAEEFLDAGRLYFADVWRQWTQFGVGSGHCVEIGCGSARVTSQLVSVFDHVTALDVSPDQLARASELLGSARSRVSLRCVSAPSIPLPDGSADAVFSCEVFQHFESDTPFLEYLREAFRVLTPSGTICFQVPVGGFQSPSFLSSAVRTRVLGVLRRLGRRRLMIYRRFQGDVVLESLRSLGFRDVEMRLFHIEQEGYHAYFFGRKP